ncbi:MAG: hypothetical protein ACFFDJ_00035 [Candidatus Odinarchaeota archaeon]
MAVRERKRRKKSKVPELKAELYGTIATLDSIVEKYEEGDLSPTLYKRQFKSLVRDTLTTRQLLESEGESWDHFVKEEKITERFPVAVEKLQIGERAPEGEKSVELAAQTSVKMAAKTADIVSDLITLIDIAKLGDVAKMNLIVPLLDDAIILLTKYPNFPPDYWILVALKDWRNQLQERDPNETLSPEEAKQLEFQAVRWLNDFKRRLREMAVDE